MSNSTGDIATQIKAFINRRNDIIKAQKRKRVFAIIAICAGLIAVGFAINTQNVTTKFNQELVKLDREKEELEKQKLSIQEQINDIKLEKEKANEEVAQRLADAEKVAKNNLYLIEQNIKLQNQVKEAAKTGVKPRNYGDTLEVTQAVDYSKLEYVGEFEGTAYTPTVEECGNNLGYTASRKTNSCRCIDCC